MFWTDDRQSFAAETIRETVLPRLSDGDGTDPRGEEAAHDEVAAWWERSHLPVTLLLEGRAPLSPSVPAVASLLVNAVDGLINRSLDVGDPGLVIAFAESPKPAFKDIVGGYVLGQRSGDVYRTQGGSLLWKPRNRRERAVGCDRQVMRLQDAVLYLNDGFAKGSAQASLTKAGFLPLQVRHHVSFDNTALEIAQLCRGAAHLRVEARSYAKDGKTRGADHANIVTAFALGQAAGLAVSDLAGRPLDDVVISMDEPQDFICASTKALLDAAVRFLAGNVASCPLRHICEEIEPAPAAAKR
jgi:hypothetical protein